MYVRCDEYAIPGLTMSTFDVELLCGSVRIIKTMHTGFSVHVLHYANALVLTRKKPDVMI